MGEGMDEQTAAAFFNSALWLAGCGGCLLNFLIILATVSLARKKYRDPFLWGVAAFLFSFVALLLLLLLPSVQPPRPVYTGYAAAYSPPPPPSPPYPKPLVTPPPQDMTIIQTGGRVVIRSGPDHGKSYALGVQTRLGRNQDNDIFLTDGQVSRYHALIQWQNEGYVLSDLGSGNGTYLNGKPLTAPTRLTGGDIISIGNTQLEVQ